MLECYVFDTLEVAEDALDYINTTGNLPMTGKNALTGELEPNKAKMETWAEIKQRITDNKYWFPRVSEVFRSQYTQEVIDTFATNYPHVVENYSSDWVEQVSEVM